MPLSGPFEGNCGFLQNRKKTKTHALVAPVELSSGLGEEGQCLSRHLGLVAEYVAAPAATWQDIQSQPRGRGVGVCGRGTEARDEGLGARARHLCAQGEHTGAEVLATSPSTSTSSPPSATGNPRSCLKPLGQPGAKANGGVGA